MEVKQIYEILNNVTNEVIGKSDLVAEDLSNIVDVGTEIFNAASVDNYVKSLVNRIGKVVFVNRPYSGSVPSLIMDSWEYGSVREKISAEMPAASENQSWELKDGETYSNEKFYKPVVSAKFFNSMVTFEVPMSFTEKQVKESFASAAEMNAFLTMIQSAVDKSMTVKINALVMRTINHMTAETIASEYTNDGKVAGLADKSGMKAVNLLKLYNTKFGTTLTADKAITTPEFIRFAALEMALYTDRMKTLSTLFNVGGKDRFTPSDKLHTVMLSDFKNAAGVYLNADTYHENYVALPNAETVPYWQASGKTYDFDAVSKINVKTASGATVEAGGILAVMFDREACGVCNSDRRVTTAYNAKGEFFNNYYKFDCSYFNDLNENFVVFFIA